MALALPEGAITRQEARKAERDFSARARSRLEALSEAFHPIEGRWYGTHRCAKKRIQEDSDAFAIRELLRTLGTARPSETFAELPQNAILACDFSVRRFWRRPRRKVRLIGASVSPMKDLIQAGFSTRRAGEDELRSVAERLLGTPRFHPGETFSYLAVFSPTGWTEATRRLARATPRLGSGQSDTSWICLLESNGTRWTVTSPEPPADCDVREIFDLESRDEKIERVARFVREHVYELYEGQITDRSVSSELGIPVEIAREAFERMTSQDSFLGKVTDAGLERLVRRYDR